MSAINDKAILETIKTIHLFQTISVRIAKVRFNLRAPHDRDPDRSITSEWATKEKLSSTVSLEGTVVNEPAKNKKIVIEACIDIRTDKKQIKDLNNHQAEKPGRSSSRIDLENHGWLAEPHTYWGCGYFYKNQLMLELLCTEKELLAMLPGLFCATSARQDSREVTLSCQIAHPDHTINENPWPPRFSLMPMTEAYEKDGWHEGVFCVTGWSLNIETSV